MAITFWPTDILLTSEPTAVTIPAASSPLNEGKPDQDCSQRPINPDFMLNQDRYKNASVLLARRNFGCGSSREHAPWALEDFGFHVIIAPSFADIFYNNCFKNGLLPIVLDEEIVDRLFHETEAEEGYQLAIDLEAKTVTTPSGESFNFEVDDFRRHCLLNGLDDIGVTLEDAEVIKAYEASRRETAPWLFDAGR